MRDKSKKHVHVVIEELPSISDPNNDGYKVVGVYLRRDLADQVASGLYLSPRKGEAITRNGNIRVLKMRLVT